MATFKSHVPSGRSLKLPMVWSPLSSSTRKKTLHLRAEQGLAGPASEVRLVLVPESESSAYPSRRMPFGKLLAEWSSRLDRVGAGGSQYKSNSIEKPYVAVLDVLGSVGALELGAAERSLTDEMLASRSEGNYRRRHGL